MLDGHNGTVHISSASCVAVPVSAGLLVVPVLLFLLPIVRFGLPLTPTVIVPLLRVHSCISGVNWPLVIPADAPQISFVRCIVPMASKALSVLLAVHC
jgi:hypothetical protein